MADIVYFYVEEDWRSVSPAQANDFCNWLSKKSGEEIREESLCISVRYENLVQQIWVTCTKDFLGSKFPELLGITRDKPQYSEFLDYKEKNFGIHNLEPKNPEKDITDHVC